MALSTLWFAIHKADGMEDDHHGGAICFAVGLARLDLAESTQIPTLRSAVPLPRERERKCEHNIRKMKIRRALTRSTN